jgi:hypothetical protein
MWFEGGVELVEYDAAFDFAPETAWGDLPNAAEGRRVNDDAPLSSDRTTGQ